MVSFSSHCSVGGELAFEVPHCGVPLAVLDDPFQANLQLKAHPMKWMARAFRE
ncbi:MAG TPA: hypothetical protein VIJ15_13065 [Dermatophilaceae bacterium]